LLNDPIMDMLLARDGVSADELRILIERTQKRLGLGGVPTSHRARQFATSLM
jgi:hypothetical protein